MNKWITTLFVAALATGSALADVGAPTSTAKDLAKQVDKVNYVETDVPGVKLNGYVDVGYIYNFVGGSSGNNSILNRFHQDSKSAGDFNVNAVKLTLEKPLSDKNELQAGFRVDAMLGEDAMTFNNINFDSGNELFIEQAYVTVRAPWGNGVDFKVGRFVTWLGYEVIERPSNLNISYGNLFQNMIPLFHQGVSAETRFCDLVDGGLAITNGYNSITNSGGSGDIGQQTFDGYAIEAKVNVKNKAGNANIQNSVYYSWDSSYQVVTNPGSVSYNNGNVVIYDVWGNWAPKCMNDKLLLGFNTDLGYAEIDNYNKRNDTTGTTWWGAALYSKYKFTNIFSLAARADYIHTDDSGVKFGDAFPTNGGGKAGSTGGFPYGFNNEDLWSGTLTAAFDVVENLTIRTEYRVDFGDDTVQSAQSHTSDIGHTAVVEAVYTF